MLLQERLAQSDLVDVPDWKAAEILNTPDAAFPPVVTLVETRVGPGVIMATLGADAGAVFLDALDAMSNTSPRIRWAMFLIKGAGINIADPQVRQTIGELTTGGVLTAQQAATLLALAEQRRLVSWAEHHGIEVTARTVGLARGGI